MPQCLLDLCQVCIGCDQVRRKGVLQRMRMALVRRQIRCFRDCLEYSEKLTAVERPALLTREKGIRVVRWAFPQPPAQRNEFVQQRVAFMGAQRLRCGKGTFQTVNPDCARLHVNGVGFRLQTSLARRPWQYATRIMAQSRVLRSRATFRTVKSSLGASAAMRLRRVRGLRTGI